MAAKQGRQARTLSDKGDVLCDINQDPPAGKCARTEGEDVRRPRADSIDQGFEVRRRIADLSLRVRSKNIQEQERRNELAHVKWPGHHGEFQLGWGFGC